MLKIYFLNVGKGSSTIIDFPSGNLTMIDIDDSRSFEEEDLDEIAELLDVAKEFSAYKALGKLNAARELVEKEYTIELIDPITFLQEKFPNRKLFRFILTHPDMDHMSGLNRLANEIGFTNFWDTQNNKTISSDTWANQHQYKKEDWDKYQALRQSENDPKCLFLHRGDSDHYWEEDGIEILSPSKALDNLANDKNEYNHISYVLRINYKNRHILIGGDASTTALENILDKIGQEGMKSDVLLAPHHGSKTHFDQDAVDAISPQLTIVSVAVGTDYAYQEYSKYGKVLSTKWYGNITVTIQDDGKITYSTEYKRAN